VINESIIVLLTLTFRGILGFSEKTIFSINSRVEMLLGLNWVTIRKNMCIDLIIWILFWGTNESKYPVFGGIHALKLVGLIWFLHNFGFVNRFQVRVLTSGSMDFSGYNLVSYVEATKLVYRVNMRYYGGPVLIVQDSFTSFTFVFKLMTRIKDAGGTSTIVGNL
jgi:hypothetical protein